MKNYLKEYFTFTKRERTGIIMLIALILICTAFPRFFAYPLPPDKKAVEKFTQLFTKWRLAVADTGYTKPFTNRKEYSHGNISEPGSITLFQFDPNTLTNDGWKKLGLADKTIQTIRNYISHGGRFRKPVDLARVYGLRKEIYDRLLPYVHIQVDSLHSLHPDWKHPLTYAKPKERAVIDINSCDTAALIELPGIGSRLAQRIINFREKLGGFYSVEQIGEVYGLPDSTFGLVRRWLICPGTALKKVNINTADINILRQHPYIKWSLATAIVRFREQHGLYKSLDELMQIAIMTPEIFKKIVFYLSIE